ncbi:hypothetical protein LY76DRAFT_586770 [Colletotrichum caudatum]|nr:hypothetical protein LY76DRAFT_586770 [Colletotrichum caudatum]
MSFTAGCYSTILSYARKTLTGFYCYFTFFGEKSFIQLLCSRSSFSSSRRDQRIRWMWRLSNNRADLCDTFQRYTKKPSGLFRGGISQAHSRWSRGPCACHFPAHFSYPLAPSSVALAAHAWRSVQYSVGLPVVGRSVCACKLALGATTPPLLATNSARHVNRIEYCKERATGGASIGTCSCAGCPARRCWRET